MGDGGPEMQSSIVAIWLANLPYRQSTDNAANVNTMVTHWKNRFIWRRYCRKKYQWFGMVWTTIFVKTVVKIVDLLNEHDVKKYNSQMFRCNLWKAALYLSYMKALKKRIQQISWTTPNCNIVVIEKKSEIKNRKKTKQELICT